MMLLMWTAHPPPETPIVDDHVVDAIVLIGLALSRVGDALGARWRRTALVRRLPWLA